MSTSNKSMALTGEPPKNLSIGQKIGILLGLFGLGILLLAVFNLNFPNKTFWLTLSLSAITVGVIWFTWDAYSNKTPGIKNDGVWFKSISSRGLWGWVAGLSLTGFYIVLYFYPEYLGLVNDGKNKGIIAFFDPLSIFLNGNPASQWFVYGTLYTVAILAFGTKFLWKYRHNRYE
ncbi:MAG TPA: FeS-binding protein, partial [Muricauda sp.]|nr:FeS-binding protein [Allomuricauda sp.]